jgi:hypothetical protein
MNEEEIKQLVIDGYIGWFVCPYCGKLHQEFNTMCCKEVHCIEIK